MGENRPSVTKKLGRRHGVSSLPLSLRCRLEVYEAAGGPVRRDLFAEVCRVIRTLHPYEVPEIIATPVVDGVAAYLDWMERELRPARED